MPEILSPSILALVTPTFSPLDPALAPFRDEILTSDGLKEHARALATGHKVAINRLGGRLLQKSLKQNRSLLEYAYFLFAKAAADKESIPLGVDWLLDNFHAIEEHMTDMRRHFPASYCNALPKLLSGSLNGYPRVYQLAVELLAHTDSLLKRDLISTFVGAYQEIQSLSIGELWAMPIMFRAALIENLTRITLSMQRAHELRRDADKLCDELLSDEQAQGTDLLLKVARCFELNSGLLKTAGIHVMKRLGDRGPKAALALRWLEERMHEQGLVAEDIARTQHQTQAANQLSIGNTVSSLKLIGQIHWRDWFEQISLLEPILRSDPAGAYAESDFFTRDRYRARIETMARRSRLTELEVGRRLITFATRPDVEAQAQEDSELHRKKHIGYYLIDQGSEKFERSLEGSPPLHLRIRRVVKRYATAIYLGLVITLVVCVLLPVAHLLITRVASSFSLALLVCLLVIPTSELALNLVQWAFSHVMNPKRLPKLDFSKGIPDNCRTAVTIHAIFSSTSAIEKVVEGLEVRFLANDDPNLHIGLLADLHDADHEDLPTDSALVTFAENKIRGLNEKYCADGAQRFFLMFRKRLFNPSQNKFMAWERKRGKICEFNRFVRGDTSTTLKLCVGDREFLQSIRFVITLDIDSQLPRESATKLVGALAHPLNRPIFNTASNTVTQGYAIIQPRIGPTVSSAHMSRFSELFSGHPGLDPYTQAVSDIYQDLFGEGSFVGKAIYDVDAFSRALKERVPENSLLSHDLFEGLFARVGLATDIELLDDFPAKYLAHARRQHRWVRGDWQLVPWLQPFIRSKSGAFGKNPLSLIEIWKIADNLRRSLVAPCSLAFLITSWVVIPSLAWLASALVLLVIAFPLYARLANALVTSPLGLSLRGYLRSIYRDALQLTQQSLLVASFLPHQAWLVLHAIAVTLFRVTISRRNLLEWETAYHSDHKVQKQGLGGTFTAMWMTSGTAFAVALILAALAPSAIPAALPFLGLWLFAPVIAYRCSEPSRKGVISVEREEERYLRVLAHDTWRFFDEMMTSEHNYLMPDNLQLVPERVVADRTSPTNIALSLLSVAAAYDLGFIPTPGVVRRIERVVDSLMKLERYRGHFLNWYQTTGLRSLAPRYISTVDSGNFVGHLMTLDTTLLEYLSSPIYKREICSHLARSLTALVEGEDAALPGTNLKTEIELFTSASVDLGSLCLLQRAASALLRHYFADKEVPHSLRAIKSELQELADLEPLIGWVEGVQKIMQMLDVTDAVRSQVHAAFSTAPSLLSLQTLLKDLLDIIAADPAHPIGATKELLRAAAEKIDTIVVGARKLRSTFQKIVLETDFRFLYDEDRRLFVIGYNLDNAQSDNATYDLLASEARLGSLVAIALGQVPQRHWFALGRQLADSLGGKALVSWSGTMFEYLMPILVTKSYPDTLLDETYRAVLKAQRQYGKLRGVPWGLSESGYSGVDFHKTYQYRAFGVPGLGLKRGLVEDLVISPYSTMLALPLDPRLCIKNLRNLEREGARGDYGFFEAIDYTVERLGSEKKHIVQSLFAHHQGMGLLSIVNLLYSGIFQERFHRDPRIKATELLLQERFPDRIPAIVPHQTELTFGIETLDEEAGLIAQIYTTPHTAFPRTALISNRSYSVMVDNTGAGWSFFDREISLTRWREDPVVNSYGSYIFVRDRDTGHLWSTAYQPTRIEPEHYEAIFKPDKLEFRRRDFGISLHTEITVSAEDNVEIRRVTLTNLSDTVRTLDLTSYAEVALTPTRADTAHPAFSKMFVESEFISDFDALLFSRRPRSIHEPRLYLLHSVVLKVTWGKTEFESSREQFLGRGRDIHNPRAFDVNQPLSGSVGPVLDPIMSLRTKIEIEPRSSQTVVFVTATGNDRESVLHLGKKYQEIYSVTRAFEMALSQSNVEMRQDGVTPGQIHAFQYLANALFFNVREVRAAPSFIVRNRLTQSGLWRLGISGDLPIVLVTVSDPEQIKAIRELILAHHYLRVRGLMFDIVILNEYPGGYTQAFQEELEHSVKSSSEGGLLDKKGGIFIRTKTQVAEEELILLQALARVALSAGGGSLQKQLDELMDGLDAKLPIMPLPKPRTKRRIASELEMPSLQLFNGIGGFAGDGKEYHLRISHDALPPLPWSNVIANADFGFLVSETGAGYTWCENSRENRLTPWFNDPVTNPVGEALYIKDNTSGEFWSPTPAPVRADAVYQVTHGMGYSIFRTSWQEISSELVLHTAEMERIKWWHLTLSNQEQKPRSLSIYLYLQLTLGIQAEEAARTVVTSFDTSAQTLYAVNHYNNEFAGRIVYVGSSESIASYTSDRAEFIGVTRDLSAPHALLASPSMLGLKSNATLSRKVGAGLSPCAVLQVKVDLEPGETRDMVFCLGEAPTLDEMRRQSARFRNKRTAEMALEGVKKYWQSLTNSIQVRTPDRSFDVIMNGWLVYQACAGRLYGRSALYQSGGAFGFRDQLQDCLSLLHAAPELVRRQILLHTSRQFIEGDVQHWWHPPTGRGVRTRISDDLLWLPYVVEKYIEATGDKMILEEDVSFIESSELAAGQMEAYLVPSYSTRRATIYDHCVLAIERALKFGPHGIPCIGCGDWNDGMNEVGVQGKGESIWLGWFLCDVLARFAKVSRLRRDEERAVRYEGIATQVAAAIEKDGWDGEWYLRAYFDNGTALGSHSGAECQIDSIAQSWGIISGFADKERRAKAYQHACERLVKEKEGIILLLTPPFDKSNLEPGYIKGYLPGVRENGGQYTHAACWLVIASALLGRGATAHKLFSLINPVNHALTREQVATYKGEPYVLCGDVYSVPPHDGRAGWSWYTGSASWLYQAGLEYILGIKIRADDIEISPCVPPTWDYFKVNLSRSGVAYEIEVHNPKHVESGVVEILANGIKIEGSRITYSEVEKGEKKISVRVTMGNRAAE